MEKGSPFASPSWIGLVTREVKEINFSGSGHNVKGSEEDEEGRTECNREEIEIEDVPKMEKVLELESGEMSRESGEERE